MRSIDTKVDAADPSATIVGEGLVLRPWLCTDVDALVTLYNTDEMNRWTPIAHPFDHEQARAYLERAASRAGHAMVQRAITEDAVNALGEIMLFATETAGLCELGYAVDVHNRGRSLAARSIRAMLPVADELGYEQARLRVVVGNRASEAVARFTGFAPCAAAPVSEQRKGLEVEISTWTRPVADPPTATWVGAPSVGET